MKDYSVSRRRLLTGAGAFGVAALGLPACGGDDDEAPMAAAETPPETPVAGGILRTLGGPIDTVLDIHRAKTPTEALPWHWIANFLLRLSPLPPFAVEPDLAAALPEITPDGLVLTFHLRPEAKWQDRAPVSGRAVTAEDVKATFDRIRALGAKSPRAGTYSVVDSVTAVAPGTVQFKLKSPQADLLGVMADGFDAVLPKEISARGDEAIKSVEDLVGSGPYEVSTFEPYRRVQLRRRGDGPWRAGTARLDGWDFLHVLDENQKANSLLAGQADMADVPTVIARLFDQEAGFQVLRATTAARECLFLNHASGPLKDPRVRLAVSRAVDRREVYGTVYEGAGVPGGPMTPAAVAWALPEAELRLLPGFGERDNDVVEAKKLLLAAGFPSGFDEKLITVDTLRLPDVANLIAGQLAKVGIRLKVEVVAQDFSTLQERLKKADFSFALTVVLAGMHPDAQLYLYHHSKAASNYGKYAIAELDAKLEKQRGLYSQAERLPLVHDVQRIILNQPGPIWLGSRVQATVASDRFRGLAGTPFSAGYAIAENAWLRA